MHFKNPTNPNILQPPKHPNTPKPEASTKGPEGDVWVFTRVPKCSLGAEKTQTVPCGLLFSIPFRALNPKP